MEPTFTPLEQVHLIAKVADMKEVDYQNMLVLHALIDLLIEKGALTREQLISKAHELDGKASL